jgi:hypothetical protein
MSSKTETLSVVTVIRGGCASTSPASWGPFFAASATTGSKGAGEGDAGAVASVDSESVVSDNHSEETRIYKNDAEIAVETYPLRTV